MSIFVAASQPPEDVLLRLCGRLQILLLAHERACAPARFAGASARKSLRWSQKHVKLDPDKVTVRLDRGEDVLTPEVDIEVPNGFEKRRAALGLD